MPEQNEQKQPKAPAFNPKVKATIAAFKEENSPKNLNDILNELVRSPLLAPAVFDLQGQPAPQPGPDGRVQLPVRPGLGVDVNKELVLEENKTPHEWKNPVWRHKDGSVAEW